MSTTEEKSTKDLKEQLINEAKASGHVVQQEKYPTEIIDLPSKGKVYPKTNLLSSGQVEMRYMTTKDEDILTSANLIQKGIVIDKLIEGLVVTPVDFNSMIIGDRNAIMFAARILGYGSEYRFTHTCPQCGYVDKKPGKSVDLTSFKDKEIDFSIFEENSTYFTYTHPRTNVRYKFKLATHGIEEAIQAEIKGLQRINPDLDPEVSTRLKHIIVSVNDNTDPAFIRDHVDRLLAIDSRVIRKVIRDATPDINRTAIVTCSNCSHEEEAMIAIDATFFWPDARA